MRLQRSPSNVSTISQSEEGSSSGGGGGYTVTLSPASSVSSASSGHRAGLRSHRRHHTLLVGGLSPFARSRHAGPSHHPHHHTRRSSSLQSLASVDLHSGAESTPSGHEAHLKAPAAAAATSSQVVTRVNHTRVPTSYAAQAYREFLHSGGSSAVTSAASSVAGSAASSRHPSRGGSDIASHVVSGHASRSASPTSKDRSEEGSTVTLHSSQPASQFVDSVQFPPAKAKMTTTTTTTTTVTQQVSTLSFDSMKSDSDESLNGVMPGGPPRLRPNHFTFCQEDIMKSFIRAAERDRARAEREAERAREHQQRLELEAEYERRKKAARDAAYHSQSHEYGAFRGDTVGADFSSDDDSPPYHRRRDGRRFPPVPAHFKFTPHDVTKSASKPSQRQNIGHWSTFPRSSTVVISASQLRTWIDTLIEQQAAERQRKMASAPTSPHAHRKHDSQAELTTHSSHSSSRIPSSRRASLPLVQAAHAHVVKVSGSSRVPRPTHKRSNTVMIEHPKDIIGADTDTDKVGLSASDKGAPRAEGEKNTAIRRPSIGSAAAATHARTASGDSFGHSAPVRSAYDAHAAAIAARRIAHATMPVKGSSVATALDGSSLHTFGRRSSGPANLSGYVASAPSSANHSPTSNMRLVHSTHVSPTRSDRTLNATRTAATAGAGVLSHAASGYAPTRARRVTLTGGESKPTSTHTSPVHASRPPETAPWPASLTTLPYEKMPLEKLTHEKVPHGAYNAGVVQHHQRHGSGGNLYKDVHSSGYGQRQVNHRHS